MSSVAFVAAALCDAIARVLFQLLRTAHGLYGERQWDSH